MNTPWTAFSQKLAVRSPAKEYSELDAWTTVCTISIGIQMATKMKLMVILHKVLIGVTDLPSPVEILEDGHPDGNLDEFREKQERELQHISQ